MVPTPPSPLPNARQPQRAALAFRLVAADLDLELTPLDGETRTLGDFAGKTLVLWFYPKADTPG